jgi:integrase
MAGDGSIYRRDERTWVAQLSIGGRGRRRYVRRNVRTKAEAREALDELRTEHRAGVKRSRLTTGDYLERWVADVRNIRPSTRHGYSAAISYHLVPAIGHIRLFDLSPIDVEGMLTRLAPSMSPKMLANVHAVLRRALTHAARVGLVTRNVAGRDFVDAPSVRLGEPDALTHAELEALIDAARGDRLEALFVTAIGTGLRQGELLGLAWEDLDLDGGRLTVRHELARIDGRYVLADPKTDRSRRTVPLAPAVVQALRAHRDRMIGEGFIPTAPGPVFVNREGGALNGSWVTHHLYRLLERAGVRRIPFKNLRSTFASRLFDAGVPDRRVADLLGHTRVSTTQRHYISTVGASEVDAVEAVSALLSRESHESHATRGIAVGRGE